MTYLKIHFLITVMFFAPASQAQQKQENSIEWKIAGELPGLNGRKSLGVAGVVTGIINDMLLIAGGSNFPGDMPWRGGKKKHYDDIYLFRQNNGTLIHVGNTLKLPAAVSYAASCTTPSGVVYAGGENEHGAGNKVWLLHAGNTPATIVNKRLPDLPMPIANASLAYHAERLYLAGGENIHGVSNKFLSLNLNELEKGWIELSQLPHAASHAVLIAAQNSNNPCIYLIGGREKKRNGISDIYPNVYVFDISENKWIEKQNLPEKLAAHSGVALDRNNILIFGGDNGKTFNQSETLTEAINKETDQNRKKILIEKKINLQSAHPGFGRDLLLYNTTTDKWRKCSEIPFEVSVTTTAVLWGNEIIIPGGEIKAGVRTPSILMGKIPGK